MKLNHKPVVTKVMTTIFFIFSKKKTFSEKNGANAFYFTEKDFFILKIVKFFVIFLFLVKLFKV